MLSAVFTAWSVFTIYCTVYIRNHARKKAMEKEREKRWAVTYDIMYHIILMWCMHRTLWCSIWMKNSHTKYMYAYIYIWFYKRVEFGRYNLFQYFASNKVFCILYGVCVCMWKRKTPTHTWQFKLLFAILNVSCLSICSPWSLVSSAWGATFCLFNLFGLVPGMKWRGGGVIQTGWSWSTVSVAFNEYMAPFVNFLFGISCLLLTGYSGRLHATVPSVW